MDHYIEIRILPDPDLELSEARLMAALFSKLHRALVSAGEGGIGVSFPGAATTPGDRIRLHGSRAALSRLEALSWRKGLTDYTDYSGILPVPETAQYRIVRRVQCQSSAERLRRRSVRKGWLSEEEAKVRIPYAKERLLSLPYLRLKSLSSSQTFLLFIEQGPLVAEPVPGRFSAYGLSSQATVPWF
ncbi:type I-F CRISPR-associated endoribonuclease Cas6/Csy4 [Erwinia psidii]|uniref:Type I-F CRISPR-associated endoribonuclease Cas6/Csy4 n=1 Tax=Erwinia psidii TaxID=69224 RepID=A0A3N6S0W7_9GAMM|nr:type I-F CRISPR-associated endoribonuclease Cas6/Csy4 [Erwinia psidii]MCX8957821.1 type I-F CRISPR-associated endoribonuclease Cas6/Csy4 [Erwinia psidii]MCX8960871.1 type I-F CRISPR-associated endoribonuclease Cas6/Csy4 [Erwinia psidii]MCX8964889.1 type I-F CRISPR-associated endoribonuclease Cas6/Csy4 [Erwinia psidii]RQM38437.1 type I-F CRISPR-associated endoribonuclease Cas6/Csy4 [Erwinia psidii]